MVMVCMGLNRGQWVIVVTLVPWCHHSVLLIGDPITFVEIQIILYGSDLRRAGEDPNPVL